MSLWRRLREGLTGARGREAVGERERSRREPGDRDRVDPSLGPRAQPAVSAANQAVSKGSAHDELGRLGRIGAVGGPSGEEGIAMLRGARGTVRESEALAAALEDADARVIPGPIRVACAEILATRGQDKQALLVLRDATTTPALILSADLLAARGQVARAVATIERALAIDLDAQGARERHARWRSALGAIAAPARRLDEVTSIAAHPVSGPFRLVSEVARGGAGAVYEAEDSVLGRRVAFKVYHGRGADRALLLREARHSAMASGPGVVRVYDADPELGWIALEWIGRGSLRDVMRKGDLAALVPIETWAVPLARALARIHAMGVVHADVKPANVLLRSPSDPVLGDFGIAQKRGEAPAGGSAGYVSPERLGGSVSDPRDDVYGFGRILEDVLHLVDRTPGLDAPSPRMRDLARRCLAEASLRPVDGSAILRDLG